MKPRHVCDDFKCVVCSPSTAKAYEEGQRQQSEENEMLFLKMEKYRTALQRIEETNKNGPGFGMSDFKIRNQMEDIAIQALYPEKSPDAYVATKEDK